MVTMGCDTTGVGIDVSDAKADEEAFRLLTRVPLVNDTKDVVNVEAALVALLKPEFSAMNIMSNCTLTPPLCRDMALH